MYKINDYVVYKRGVCKVIDIKINHLSNKDYYVLCPIEDETLKIEVPTENRLGSIRTIISKEEVDEVINKIAEIPPLDSINERLLEQEYRSLLNQDGYEPLIKIIKTTYLRNEERAKNKKKIGEKDNAYFEKAERMLYSEFSIALNMSYEETKEYVINKVAKSITNEK